MAEVPSAGQASPLNTPSSTLASAEGNVASGHVKASMEQIVDMSEMAQVPPRPILSATACPTCTDHLDLPRGEALTNHEATCTAPTPSETLSGALRRLRDSLAEVLECYNASAMPQVGYDEDGFSSGYDYPFPTPGATEPTLFTEALELGEIGESSPVHGDLAVLREEASSHGMDMVSTVDQCQALDQKL